jgi:hypothetical protein
MPTRCVSGWVRQVGRLGHSFGGQVALEYALHSPDRLSHLVLLDTGGDSRWSQQKAADLLARRGSSPEAEVLKAVSDFLPQARPSRVPHPDMRDRKDRPRERRPWEMEAVPTNGPRSDHPTRPDPRVPPRPGPVPASGRPHQGHPPPLPQTSVVGCDLDSECVPVNTMRDLAKEPNLRRNPRVTLLCDDPRQPHAVDERNDPYQPGPLRVGGRPSHPHGIVVNHRPQAWSTCDLRDWSGSGSGEEQ